MKKKGIAFVAILAMISMLASACPLLGGQTTPFEDGAESADVPPSQA